MVAVPGAGPSICVTVTGPQLSTATGLLHIAPPSQIPGKSATVNVSPEGQFTNTGGSVSVRTVTLNEHSTYLPEPVSVKV